MEKGKSSRGGGLRRGSTVSTPSSSRHGEASGSESKLKKHHNEEELRVAPSSDIPQSSGGGRQRGSARSTAAPCLASGPNPKTCNSAEDVGRPWADLPMDIMQTILQSLQLLDSIRVSRACKRWRSIVPSILPVGTLSYGPPCLLYVGADDAICDVFDPIHNENIAVFNTEFMGARVHFARDGWLLLSWYVIEEVVEVFFLNPLTGAKIELPPVTRDFAAGFSFSSVPTSPDCVVVAISGMDKRAVTIEMCRRGDAVWSTSSKPSRPQFDGMLTNPVYHLGSFYALSENGSMGIFNVEEDTWTVVRKPKHIGGDTHKQFLVESNGDLLVVYDLEKSVEVYRFDPNKKKWVEVESLQNQVLYLGMLVSTSAEAMGGGTPNTIYFNRLRDGSCMTYSLGSRSFHPRENPYMYKEFPLGVWVVLERSQPSPEELKWYKKSKTDLLESPSEAHQ